ncbi:pilus assembly protein CpaE [Herbiconiux sp. CPCC 203407]|uniref:Pilus assembly protein CpaE n=1 Tax=Herbiconiux oxytropis TaxID=2970915 RepID=A0AA41XDT1_9MICO|nr:pilus assembly protein CpaE [Herbiconiux oxytropis]MCS5722644.1 pilus assembly protein CpaE [Herbiconiux oxytropis]MCS5726342.1 pilus assembly protein CpaE [Herbiconiux oxytropis]
MIAVELARALRTAGLRWHPRSGDAFVIETVERASESGAAGEVFTVSEMTAEVHEFPSGTLIGFNGTTEWALDSVDLTDTLWLPREDQLREILREGFRSLTAEQLPGEPGEDHVTLYVVTALIRGRPRRFEAESAVDAYAEAVLDLIVQSLVADEDD